MFLCSGSYAQFQIGDLYNNQIIFKINVEQGHILIYTLDLHDQQNENFDVDFNQYQLTNLLEDINYDTDDSDGSDGSDDEDNQQQNHPYLLDNTSVQWLGINRGALLNNDLFEDLSIGSRYWIIAYDHGVVLEQFTFNQIADQGDFHDNNIIPNARVRFYYEYEIDLNEYLNNMYPNFYLNDLYDWQFVLLYQDIFDNAQVDIQFNSTPSDLALNYNHEYDPHVYWCWTNQHLQNYFGNPQDNIQLYLQDYPQFLIPCDVLSGEINSLLANQTDQIEDCDGNGEYFPENMIGNGTCDGPDQPYGVDLSCYDNDGGDCDVFAPAGQILDCDGSGEYFPEHWLGDGYCDGLNQAYGADLSCYDNDHGDCGDCENDDSTTDICGDSCSEWYDIYEYPGSYGCNGAYDSYEFNASEQCCACQESQGEFRLDSESSDSIKDIISEISNEYSVLFNHETNRLTVGFDDLSIEGQPLYFELYDMLGKRLVKNQLSSEQTYLSIASYLSPGAYLLKVTTQNNKTIKALKFIKN